MSVGDRTYVPAYWLTLTIWATTSLCSARDLSLRAPDFQNKVSVV
jgi:hypothetical protein